MHRRPWKLRDVAGVNWHLQPFPHFSGNMWWATARYIRTLPRPCHTGGSRWARYMAERWIGMNADVRVACLHQSLVNHYETFYPAAEYDAPSDRLQPVTALAGGQPPSPWQTSTDEVNEVLRATLPLSLIVQVGTDDQESLSYFAAAAPNAKILALDVESTSTPAGPDGSGAQRSRSTRMPDVTWPRLTNNHEPGGGAGNKISLSTVLYFCCAVDL